MQCVVYLFSATRSLFAQTHYSHSTGAVQTSLLLVNLVAVNGPYGQQSPITIGHATLQRTDENCTGFCVISNWLNGSCIAFKQRQMNLVRIYLSITARRNGHAIAVRLAAKQTKCRWRRTIEALDDYLKCDVNLYIARLSRSPQIIDF